MFFANAYSGIGRTFVGWQCKGCERSFGGGTHCYLCRNHDYGGGEFCSKCARKYHYYCPICGNYIG